MFKAAKFSGVSEHFLAPVQALRRQSMIHSNWMLFTFSSVLPWHCVQYPNTFRSPVLKLAQFQSSISFVGRLSFSRSCGTAWIFFLKSHRRQWLNSNVLALTAGSILRSWPSRWSVYAKRETSSVPPDHGWCIQCCLARQRTFSTSRKISRCARFLLHRYLYIVFRADNTDAKYSKLYLIEILLMVLWYEKYQLFRSVVDFDIN